MPTIKFEGLVPSNSSANVPNGYAGLRWANFGVIGREQAEGSHPFTNGYLTVMHNKAAGILYDFGLGVSSLFQAVDNVSTLSLKSGIFAAAWNNDETLTIRAWRGDVVVGQKTVVLDQDDAMTIAFGHRFRHVDYVTFVSSGGTDANSGDHGVGGDIAIDNLELAIDGPHRHSHAHEAAVHDHAGLVHDTWNSHWADVPFV